jgi:arylsulfatase
MVWLLAVFLVTTATSLVVGHLGLPWHEGSSRTARIVQMLVLLAAASAVSLASLRRPPTPGEDEDPRQRMLSAATGGMLAALVWLTVPVLRVTTSSPLAVLLMTAPVLAVFALASPSRRSATGGRVATTTRRRPSAPAVAAIVLAMLTLVAFVKRRPLPPDVLPLAEALGGMRSQAPDIREILPGPGLTPGVLAHVGRRMGMAIAPRVGSKPRRTETTKVGVVSIASETPAPAERDSLAAQIGLRVLDRTGFAGEQIILRWTTLRPLSLRIDPSGARPNIAIISVDTLRADHLGVYGYARATSPLLDAWSQSALVYERAMSAAPATAPSFSSLMTGRLPIAHGVRKNYEFLDAGNWTLARILARAGYDTAGFISSFVLSRENSGLDLGIAHYDQTFEGREANREDRPLRLAPALAESVGAWLDTRRAAEAPWFLWVHAIDPHGPYTPLPEFQGTFRGGDTRSVERSLIPQYQWLGTTDFATYVGAYDDEILQTDRSLGALIAKIEAIPSPAGTIIVFTADHGEAFGEHGFYFEHGQSLHTEEIHVPLIVKDSARPRSGRTAAPVSLLDLVPTLLQRLSIESDLPFDGTTMGARESPDGGALLLGNWRPGEVMACRSPWKLIVAGSAGGHHASEGRKAARSTRVSNQNAAKRTYTGAPRAGEDPLAGRVLRFYDMAADPSEARPVSPPPPGSEELLAAARALLVRDPLDAASGRALEKRQWETLTPEAQEKLRSLGYAGP